MNRHILLHLLIISVLTILVTRAPAIEPHRLAITQYGVTWTFVKPKHTGQYVTGDWWVVGPVTLKSITPNPTPGRHGSVINPPAGAKQGYDDRISGFDASLRIKLPMVLKPGDSLVTTASVSKIGVKTPDTVRRQYCRGPLRTAVVLTCVKSPPPADAFRPGYVGKWKKQYTRSQLKRSALPRLKVPKPISKTVPNAKPYERYLQRIWLDHMRQWVNRKMHPLENMPDYGREITNIVSDVALLLCLEDPKKQRETLLLQFVQKGIDYYAATQSDNNLWIANGGHNSGRKYPILFAGLMLGDKEMLSVKATFQEDQQTYYGPRFGHKGKQALWTIAPGNPNAHHEEADPKKWPTYGSGSNNGTKADAYRKLNGPTWVGQALAARLTKLDQHWSHPPFFDYVDRWIKEDGGPKKGFVREMWNQYR
ncbi:MAG: hypothetical protein HN350_15025 [Phycisphaerales bacterium]|jgi:hypothetical protein|nr:hypothetical protein [Phycisphaerales bacterium]